MVSSAVLEVHSSTGLMAARLTRLGWDVLKEEVWVPMDRVAAEYQALVPTNPTDAQIHEAFDLAYQRVLADMIGAVVLDSEE